MRSLLFVLAIALFAFVPKHRTQELKEITASSQLSYNVDFKGQKYQFIVEVQKKSPVLVFKYDLTMNGGMQGTITMTEEALKGAINQQNYFNGTDRELKTETTVWVSSKVYNDIKKGGKTQIGNSAGLGYKVDEYKLIGTEDFATTVNGEEVALKALHIKADNGFEYWIWDNAKDPLILKMDLGWGITIKEISTN
jgi:hypothetical protein